MKDQVPTIERWVQPQVSKVDDAAAAGFAEERLRPSRFEDYPGQDRIKENLHIAVQAAKRRDQPLDHILLHGPPGLGKTTLAQIVANEVGAAFFHSSGPAIERPGDLAGVLAGMQERSVLFIDEIHRLPIAVEEVLYTAMEDFCIDVLVGQGPTARSVRMDLPPFTLIGATTRLASLSRPLVSRFGIVERLEFYDEGALSKILDRSSRIWKMKLQADGASALAKRSRGTPRVANRLLRRVRDYIDFKGMEEATIQAVDEALDRLEIDACGLDSMDRQILRVIRDRYAGGPVGLDTLAATVGEERATIEEVYEPFLVHRGYLSRLPRGRIITTMGLNHLTDLECIDS